MDQLADVEEKNSECLDPQCSCRQEPQLPTSGRRQRIRKLHPAVAKSNGPSGDNDFGKAYD